MMVLDTRQVFTDELGAPLAGCRLAFFLFSAPTTEAVVYYDAEYTMAAGIAVSLTSAGWPPAALFSPVSLWMHVQRPAGIDILGATVWEDVKVCELHSYEQHSSVAQIPTADTMADLRAMAVSDGAIVALLGYYARQDKPVTYYLFNTSSTSADNLGTVIVSDTTSVGRWTMIPVSDVVDSRDFGVIAGQSFTNAHWTALNSYCTAQRKTAYFVTGTYSISSSGSISFGCPVQSDSGVLLTSSGASTVTISKPSKFADSFAGSNVKLILSGTDWTTADAVPMTAFYNPDDLISSTAVVSIVVSTDTIAGLATDVDRELGEIRITGGARLTIVNNGTGLIKVEKLLGTGQIAGNGFSVGECSISQIYGPSLHDVTQKVRERILVDDGWPLTANWSNAFNPEIVVTDGSISGDYTMTIGGLIHGRAQSVASTLNVGFKDIPVAMLTDAFIAKSWQASAVGVMDLLGRTSPSGQTFSRGGLLKNGTIQGAISTGSFKLERITHSGSLAVTSLEAVDCSFTDNGIFTSSKLTRCSFSTSGEIGVSSAIWNEVYAPTASIKNIGGNARLSNVVCASATLVPSSSTMKFQSFNWVGGSCGTMTFDATLAGSDGEYIAENVFIDGVYGVSTLATSDNLAAKYWAVNGHSSVHISVNGGTKGTVGRGRGVLNVLATFSASGVYVTLQNAGIFRFISTRGGVYQDINYASASKRKGSLSTLSGTRGAYSLSPVGQMAELGKIYFLYTSSDVTNEGPGSDGDEYFLEWNIYP